MKLTEKQLEKIIKESISDFFKKQKEQPTSYFDASTATKEILNDLQDIREKADMLIRNIQDGKMMDSDVRYTTSGISMIESDIKHVHELFSKINETYRQSI